MQREVESLRQRLNAGLQLARLQRRKLVEQRKDRNGVYSDHEDLEGSTKQPEVVEELVTGLLHNGEETSENRWSEDKAQHLTFEYIRNEDLGSLLVESELLLQNEGAVY